MQLIETCKSCFYPEYRNACFTLLILLQRVTVGTEEGEKEEPAMQWQRNK